MPKGIPLTEKEQARRRTEIFGVSVHLFLEKGFTETSMREIAEAVGVGKSTLYDYFKSKDDILISYFEDEIRRLTDRIREIKALEIGVAEKVKRIMQLQMDYLVDHKKVYLKLTAEFQ